VLLRLAYLGVTNTLAMLRLQPMSDRAKDVEILALRHQITVLERQLHGCCAALKMPMMASLVMPMLGALESPTGGCRWGFRRRGVAGGRHGAAVQSSSTSLTAARVAASSTRDLLAAKVATRACRARLFTARG
jgi:hypothetical protein